MTPRRIRILIAIGLIAGLFLAALMWQYRHDVSREVERASLPDPVEYEEIQRALPLTDSTLPTEQPFATKIAPVTKESTPASTNSLPAEVNLAIPFTPQAPHANWSLPYKEFCEEASVFMAMQYIRGQAIPNADVADQELLKIGAFEEEYFGYLEDTTAKETATVITEYFGYPNVQLVENPTAQQIREAVAAGKPVIVPAAGRLLGNPYFQTPGPLYHMFVVKGYTSDGRFIVNDPGTRRGADFVYSETTIMNAIHDWRDDQQIELGRKVIIVVG